MRNAEEIRKRALKLVVVRGLAFSPALGNGVGACGALSPRALWVPSISTFHVTDIIDIRSLSNSRNIVTYEISFSLYDISLPWSA
jgi:hypothetical protein